MDEKVSFALIGDVQYADRDAHAGRNFRGARSLLHDTIQALNEKALDFIVSLGDLGDGFAKSEIPEILGEYAQSRHPVKYIVGNHDFVQYSENELKDIYGLDSLFYSFCVRKIRFVVLNGLDVSRFAPRSSSRYAQYEQYKREHPDRQLREWDGVLSEISRQWLRRQLDSAQQAEEDVILISHVPMLPNAGNACMWDHDELLSILDDYSHIRAYFAGHYHPGATQIRKGVLYKTVKAVCNCTIPTACICHVHDDRINLEGIGEESALEVFF